MDHSESKVYITKTSLLKDGETIEIFDTIPLTIAVDLHEYIDSINLHIEKNTLWTDTVVYINDMVINPMKFDISFNDTGWQNIELSVSYNFDSTTVNTYRVYVMAGNWDVEAPIITILNLESSDTGNIIPISEVPFTLTAKIRDTRSKLKSYIVNGQLFDSVNTINDYTVTVYKTFYSVDFDKQISYVQITASDIWDNSATVECWLYSTQGTDTTLSIFRTHPRNDCIFSRTDTVTLEGLVTGFPQNSTPVYLFTKVNDSLLPYMHILTQTSNIYRQSCTLDKKWNTVRTYLMSTPYFDSTPLDSNILYAKYIPADTVSEKPVVVSVKCGESFIIDNAICTEDTVQVSIVVRKGLWDIDTVLVNGNIAQQVNDSVFNGTMYLSHTKTGTKQIFTVRDKDNQVVKDTMTIFYNRPPVFTSLPAFQNVYAELVYTDSVLVNDSDGDTILISTQLKLPTGMTTIPVDNQGAFSWLPRIVDTTGVITVTFSANDGFEQIDSSITFKVSFIEPPVYFTITQNNFQDSINFIEDTLTVTLSTGGTSNEPRVFTVLKNDTILHGPASDSLFVWAPTKDDTGLCTLTCIVVAGTDGSDTLGVPVYVRPIIVSFADSVSMCTETENDTTISIPITISRSTPDTSFVSFEIDSTLSTATYLNDYEFNNLTLKLTFFGENTKQWIVLTIKDDTVPEENETVVIKLTNPVNGLSLDTIPEHIFTIEDND